MADKDLLDFKKLLVEADEGEIYRLVDIGLRHTYPPSKPEDYLRQWVKVARCFAYATRDTTWGELEKEFAIVVTRLIIAERMLEAVGLGDFGED